MSDIVGVFVFVFAPPRGVEYAVPTLGSNVLGREKCVVPWYMEACFFFKYAFRVVLFDVHFVVGVKNVLFWTEWTCSTLRISLMIWQNDSGKERKKKSLK